MKKRIILLIVNLFVNATLFAQLYQFFPMTSNYLSFNDTVLNTNKLMKKLGINKVMIYTVAPQGEKKSFLNYTSFLNVDGNVEKLIHCMQGLKKDTFFCYDYLSLYNRDGKPKAFFFKGQNGIIYQSDSISYPNKNESVITTFTKRNVNMEEVDTMTMHKYFKDDGKILKSEYYFDFNIFRSEMYHYSINGLIDSITYKQVPAPTYPITSIFKRTNKKKNTIIKVIEFPTTYEWTYNSEGQCAKLQITINEYYYVDNISYEKCISKTVVRYSYNVDSTLKEIVEKTDGKPALHFFYYYFK